MSAVILMGLLGSSPAAAGDTIGRKFAGTYLWVEDGSSQRVVTIARDGSFASVSQAASTYGFTDGLGSAKQTGKRAITATQIDFNFDDEGTPTGVTRVVFSMVFGDKKKGKFQSVRGSLFGETFGPDENPLDPEGSPTSTFSFAFTGQRVKPGSSSSQSP
ncbi:MAG: hypothetical protein CL938_05275 [Deltaproteobacteria bacterium]|nr:hypothetical protein [Deltaproteobacteria bacterium]